MNFANLPDDLILRNARYLSFPDGARLQRTCRQLNVLAKAEVDLWSDWALAAEALEKQFELPEVEDMSKLTPWRMKNDPRANQTEWAALSPRQRVFKMIDLGERLATDLRSGGLDTAEFFWEGVLFAEELHGGDDSRTKFAILEDNPARFHLATELATLYNFASEASYGSLSYDVEDSVLCSSGPGFPGGSSGRDSMFFTFFDGYDDETPEVFGNDELLIKWARGVEMFKHLQSAKQKDDRMFGPTILKKFDVVKGEMFLPRLAKLWKVDLEAARAKVFP